MTRYTEDASSSTRAVSLPIQDVDCAGCSGHKDAATQANESVLKELRARNWLAEDAEAPAIGATSVASEGAGPDVPDVPRGAQHLTASAGKGAG